MGICQSSACTISVVDASGHRETHNLSLKDLKALRTMSDMMKLVGVDGDKLFTQDQREIPLHAPFQIQPVVVYRGKVFQYRISMTRLY